MDALREGLERQLLALKALREQSLSDVKVCIECWLPKTDHGRSDHYPTYWEIDQALIRLEHLINPPAG